MPTTDKTPATYWCLSTGNAGSHSQARGLATTLSPDVSEVIVRLDWPWSWAPAGHLPLSAVSLKSGGPLTGPWPDVLVSSGRRGGLVARAIRKASLGKTFTVHIERPPGDPRAFDAVVALPHDGLTGPNVICVDTALHAVTVERMTAAAVQAHEGFARFPRPWTGVLLGGSTRRHPFTVEHAAGLVKALEASRAKNSGSLLITPSRRTPPAVVELIAAAFRADPTVMVWNGEGPNPYLAILGLADRLLVTSDSVSMISEALATSAPVSIFDVGGGRRHRAFLASLLDKGLVSLASDLMDASRSAPLDATAAAAAFVRDRMARR